MQDIPNVYYFIDFVRIHKSYSKNDSEQSSVSTSDCYTILPWISSKYIHIYILKFIHFDILYVSMTSLYLSNYLLIIQYIPNIICHGLCHTRNNPVLSLLLLNMLPLPFNVIITS